MEPSVSSWSSWDSRATTPQQADSSNSTRSTLKIAQKVTVDNCDNVFCFLPEFRVLVCRYHCTGVVNLNKHLSEQHATCAAVRKEIVQRFAQYERVDPKAVELPEQPASPLAELGAPLDGLCCKTCQFLTVNTSVLRIHLKKKHKQVWKSQKHELFQSVKVQTFFSSGGLQKYFIVDLVEGENREKLDLNQVVQQQLSDYQKVRKEIEDDMHVMEEAAKTD